MLTSPDTIAGSVFSAFPSCAHIHAISADNCRNSAADRTTCALADGKLVPPRCSKLANRIAPATSRGARSCLSLADADCHWGHEASPGGVAALAEDPRLEQDATVPASITAAAITTAGWQRRCPAACLNDQGITGTSCPSGVCQQAV